MPLFDVYPLYDVEPTKARGVYVYDKKGKSISICTAVMQ